VLIWTRLVLHRRASFASIRPHETKYRAALLRKGFAISSRNGPALGPCRTYSRPEAYASTTERSVHRHPATVGGIGRCLAAALTEACQQRRFRRMGIVVDDSTNEVSVCWH